MLSIENRWPTTTIHQSTLPPRAEEKEKLWSVSLDCVLIAGFARIMSPFTSAAAAAALLPLHGGKWHKIGFSR